MSQQSHTTAALELAGPLVQASSGAPWSSTSRARFTLAGLTFISSAARSMEIGSIELFSEGRPRRRFDSFPETIARWLSSRCLLLDLDQGIQAAAGTPGRREPRRGHAAHPGRGPAPGPTRQPRPALARRGRALRERARRCACPRSAFRLRTPASQSPIGDSGLREHREADSQSSPPRSPAGSRRGAGVVDSPIGEC